MTASMTTSAGNSPRHHVIADRQLEVDVRADPLVDALVARAHEHECARSARSAARSWGNTSRAGPEDDRRLLAPHGLDRGDDRLHAHHHPRAAAVGRVIDRAMISEAPSRSSWTGS